MIKLMEMIPLWPQKGVPFFHLYDLAASSGRIKMKYNTLITHFSYKSW